MTFNRKTLQMQHYLYVDRECEYGPEIAQAMESGFDAVFSYVATHGIQPQSMPMSVYLTMDPGILRFRAAVIVGPDDAAKTGGEVKTDTLPAGEAMTATHVGSYDNLNQTHEAIWKHMEAENIPAAMPVWEIYVDDPGSIPVEKVRTEIYRMIA